MKKKIVSLLLTVVLCLTVIGCGNQAPAATPAPTPEATPAVVGMPNPVQQVADYQSLLSAQPAIKLNNAVPGATNVMYSWINNIPPISQITFTVNGSNYTYRAAANQGGMNTDISGVYTQFPSTTSLEVREDNMAGGTYMLRYDAVSGEGVATWSSNLSGCQYSLYTDTGCAGAMPLTEVMKSLYVCTADAQTVSGTVLAVQNNTLTVTLDDDETVVFETNNIRNLTVAAGDTVNVVYQGSLDGSSQAIQITKTGTVSTSTFTGVMYMMQVPDLFLYTRDNNLYVFTITEDTTVSGKLSSLDEMTAGNEVKVTYTGNLAEEPLVTNIEVLKIKADPTPTPDQPKGYTTKVASGYVTSLTGGIQCNVTVSGISFKVDANSPTTTGYPSVGVWADITYRDYGTGSANFVVVKASFNNNPDPIYSTAGTVTSCSQNGHSYTVCVNGMWFTFNTRGISGSGTPSVGCWANIQYKDYGGGNYEVTSANFSGGDDPQPEYIVKYAYGTVNSYNPGSTVELTTGQVFYIAGDCTISGSIVPGYDVGIDYREIQQSHLTNEAFNIVSYYQPAPSEINVQGTVDNVSEGGGCWTVTVNGAQYMVDAVSASISGTPTVGCHANMTLVNGQVTQAIFS